VTFDVVVAGLGAMGSAAAQHLAGRGLSVLGVDPFRTPHRYGSTHGDSRIIREAYFEDPGYVPLVRRAHELWRELGAASGERLLRTTGALTVGPSAAASLAGVETSARRHAIPLEPLDREETARRFPGVELPDGHRAQLEPGAGVLDPEAGVRAQLAAARRAGAEIRAGTRLTGWREGPEGILVMLDGETIRAGQLVLAAGAWMPELLPGFPLEVERQTVHWFEPRRGRERFAAERFPAVLWETEEGRLFYLVPDLGRGVKVALHHGGERGARGRLSLHPRPDDVEAARDLLARWLPDIEGEHLRSEVCWYTNTPDGHFLIDRHPESERVLVVSPCSGHGFKFAPAIGEAVADLVTGSDPRDDLAAFRLDRAALGG
jgi:sarcosine oxidase